MVEPNPQRAADLRRHYVATTTPHGLAKQIGIQDPKPEEFAWPFPIIYWSVIALGVFGVADAVVFAAAV